ncbi:sulfotransferase family protein [Sphaerisporangium sp. NPDC004334]
MRVIGAGFGRTGTLTLKTALERLGFGPCHHMTEVIGDSRQVRRWLAVSRGETPDWDSVFAGYRSCVDWPAAAYWRELAAHYPEAKIVLTVRDPARWLDSMRATILKQRERGTALPARMMMLFSSMLGTDLAAFMEMTRRIVTEREFGGRADDSEYLTQRFEEHVAEVKAAIPPERLLVFEVRQGWEPLCGFLGVPVPDEPFPRVNDTADFQARTRSRLTPLLLRRS